MDLNRPVILLAENPIPAGHRVSRPHYLARALVKAGFKVTTITFRAEGGDPIENCRHLYLPLRIHQFGLVRRLTFLLNFLILIKEIVASRPALLHGQGLLPGLMVVAAARIFRLPCLVGLPDFNGVLYGSFELPGGRVVGRLLVRLENLVAGWADALVVESPLARTEWIGRGLSPEKIHPIHHAADASLFSPQISGRWIRERFGLKDDLLISFHGDIGHDDGVDVLIEAFRKMSAHHPQARLIIIGHGPPATMEMLATQASDLNGRVIFTGWVPYLQVPHYLAAVDIGVAPFRSSLYTNTIIPTKALEVMAMGKALVASDLTTFGQDLRSGHNCLLVRPGEVDDLAGALIRLAGDEALRKRVGRNGRALIEEKLTWEIKIQEEVKLVESLTGPRTSP